MEKKEYDLMMNMVGNQQVSIADFTASGLNVNNTSLQSIDTYRNDPYIKEQFTDDQGNFNETAFRNMYNIAAANYNVMANNNYDQIMTSQLSFHRSNIDVPQQLRRQGPDYTEVLVANPQRITESVVRLGEKGERTLSDDELAQSNKVLLNPVEVEKSGDWSKAKWGDSPENSFFSNFTETLVLAQWNDDGTHKDPITGEMTSHQKGELKVNDEGTYYYERLDGRDIYGRRVLNKMNVLTKEGSWLNQYDFFDSDDINQKSIGGSILKNAALVGLMFIQPIGPWIAGLSMATQLAGVGAVFGKMLVGSDSPTLSAIEGWSKSMSRQGAQTEYAQQHTWCWENFINLIGDVAGQLKEQRFIFEKVPTIFKGANITTKEGQAAKLAQLEEKNLKLANTKINELIKSGGAEKDIIKASAELQASAALKAQSELDSFIKGYNKIGEILSKGYMTMITVGDTYGEAKAAGASDLDATLLTLGYAAGEYAILNTGIGEWILPELRAGQARTKAIANALTKDVNTETATLRSQFGDQLKNFSKEGKKEYVKKLFNIGKKLAKAEYSTGSRGLKASIAGGIGEGIEEVSEELLADFSKGCYDVVKWLQGEDTRLNTFGYNFERGEFDAKNLLDRYSMSLIGGFVGGAVVNAGTNFREARNLGDMTKEKAVQELVYMTRNGQIDNFLRDLNKIEVGNKNLSATEVQQIGDSFLPAPGTKENNEDLFLKKAITNQVQIIRDTLTANGGNLSDQSFLNRQILGDLRFNALYNSTTAGAYLNRYNQLSTELLQITSQIDVLKKKDLDKNKDDKVSDSEERHGELSDNTKELIKEKEKQLKEVQKEIKDLIDGKKADEFVAQALFEMTPALSGEFTLTTFPLFVESITGKKFTDITDDQKQKLSAIFESWMSTDVRDRIRILSDINSRMSEQSSSVILKSIDEYLKTPDELKNINSLIQKLYPQLFTQEQIDRIRKKDPTFLLEDAADQLSNAQDATNSAPIQLGLRLVELLGSQKDIDELNAIHNRKFEFGEDQNKTISVGDTIEVYTPEGQKQDNSIYQINKETEDGTKFELINTNDNSTITIDKKELLDQLGSKYKKVDTGKAKEQWETQRKNDYYSTLQNIIANNLNSFIQPYIDRGFANVETKNQLSQLLISTQNFFKPLSVEYALNPANQQSDIWGEEEDINPYIDILTQIELAQEQVKDLNNTPLEENLNQFAYSVGAEPISLTGLIEKLNTYFNINSEDISSFSLDQNLALELNNAILTLKMYRQAILGARTDAIGIDNLYGYNATINEIRKKIGKEAKLAEIDSAVADIFIEDINTNLKKLEFLQKLFNINQGQKLIRQDKISIKKDLLIYKKLRQIITIPDKDKGSDPLVKWEGFLELSSLLDSLSYHKNALENDTLTLNPDSRKEFERETLKLEDGIYDFFQKNKEKISDVNSLMELINPKRLQLYTKGEGILNENLQDLDDNSMIWWLASRAAVKSTEFYGQYKQIIDPQAKNPIAPIPTQEMAVYINYASIVNGDIFVHFLNAYRESIRIDWKEKSVDKREAIYKELFPDRSNTVVSQYCSKKYEDDVFSLIPIPRYTNIVLTEGIPGSGKTQSVFHTTLKLLHTFHPDLLTSVAVIHGANEDSAKTLQESTGLTSSNSKTYSREKWMKEICPTWINHAPNEQGQIELDSKEVTIEDHEVISALGIKATDNPPSLIVIDEISKFSSVDLDLINRYAKKYGITVLVAGDFDQSGIVGRAYLDSKTKDFDEIELNRIQFIRTVKLGVSMRTANQTKTLNQAKLQLYLQDSSTSITLDYFQDNTGIYGDKVKLYVDEAEAKEAILKELKPDIELMINTLKPDEKIGYIYSDVNSPIYKYLFENYKDKIDFKQGGSAQGLEGQYYIVEPNINTDNHIYLREVYTGMTRAKQGSILILPNGNILPPQQPLAAKPIVEEIKKPTIVRYAVKRKKLLDELIPDTQQVPYNKRTTDDSINVSRDPESPQAGTDEDEYNGPGLEDGVDYEPPEPPSTSDSPSTLDPPPDIPITSDPPNPAEVTPMSREMIENLYGETTKISDFTIELDEVQIPLRVAQIPFISNRADGKRSGTNNVVNINDHNIIVVNINGFAMPFYQRTNGWFPFFGIGSDGWFNIVDTEHEENYYENVPFAAISQKLNDLFGTDIDSIIGPSLDITNSDTLVSTQFINTNMKPVNNNTETTIETVTANAQDTITKVNEEIENLKNRVPKKEDTPIAEPSIYADNIIPVVDDAIDADTDKKNKINKSNSESNVPTSAVTIPTQENEPYKIAMQLHSFNTFELGVLKGPNGEIIKNGNPDRIDSINGLMKIYGENKPFNFYLKKLGSLRSIIFNTADKSELCSKLQKELGLSGIYCTFALKSSAYLSEDKKAKGQEFLSENPTKIDKGASERLEYCYSTDERSQEVPNKSLVLIIGQGQDLLELPLLTLSSPFTLLQIQQDGKRVFQEMYDRYLELLRNKTPLPKISETLVKKFKYNTKYKELVDLFKLFNYTNNSVWYIRDKNWTIGNNLDCLGTAFVTKKGYYQWADGLNYSADMLDEKNWVTLEELKQNPQVTMLGRVVVSKTGRISGIKKQVVNAGHPFVLVSFNKELNNDNKIIEQWIKQQKDPNVKKEVKLMYVLPPKASIENYLDNLHRILSKDSGVQPIGNAFTSYNLLQILTKNETFRQRMEQKNPKILQKIEESLEHLNKIDEEVKAGTKTKRQAQKEKLQFLMNPQDWSSIGKGNHPIALTGLLDSSLHDFVYTRNIDDPSTSTLNSDDLQTLVNILKTNNIDGVYYNSKIPKENAIYVGRGKEFIAVTKEAINGKGGYQIDDLPYRIHGKIDSYTFRGELGDFIDSVLSLKRNGVNANDIMYSKDNTRYFKGNSNLNSQKQDKTAIMRQKNIKYVSQKLGDEIGQVLANLYEQGNKSEQAIMEANHKLVSIINDQDNNVVAFCVGNELKISNNNQNLAGKVYIIDTARNSLTNIAHLVNNNGQYVFEIVVTGSDSVQEYYAEFSNDELKLTPKVAEKTEPVILTVTAENFEQYINVARSLVPLLPNSEKPILGKIFNESQSFESFIAKMYGDKNESTTFMFATKRSSKLQKILDDPTKNLTPEQEALIKELIALNDSLDTSKQKDENNPHCDLTPIIIKF